ncbi:unnamed protein product [Linum trigynum]|uniref:Uncharacterized protein n=1 Tax=Linum trigynum TaxID=586398 RepID=A0AAV2F7C8_9ROSI
MNPRMTKEGVRSWILIQEKGAEYQALVVRGGDDNNFDVRQASKGEANTCTTDGWGRKRIRWRDGEADRVAGVREMKEGEALAGIDNYIFGLVN